MATQFTGNEKANLLSTALAADAGDNIAITATSDAVVTGLGAKDTVVLDESVSNFTVAGGEGNDSIYASAAVTSSDVQGNRGDDTIRLLDSLTSVAVKGGQNNDTIYLEGALTNASIFGGQGADSVTFNKATSDISGTLFKDSAGNNYLSVTSASFGSSTAQGGTGNDTLLVTSTAAVSKAYLQGAGGADMLKVTSDLNDSTMAGGEGNDSLHLAGGMTRSTLYGGKGNDTLTLVVGNQQIDGALIQDTSGNNTITATSNTSTNKLTVVGGDGVDKFSIAGAVEGFLFKGAAGNDSVLLDAITSSTVYGGSGDDTVEIDGAVTDVLIQTGSGTNVFDIDGTATNATINGGSGNDSLLLTTAAALTGGSYNFGAGNDTVDFDGAFDHTSTFALGDGNDMIRFTSAGGAGEVSDSTIYLGAGNDTVSAADKVSSTTIQTSGGNNRFALEAADSITITAGDGNDSLNATAGVDNASLTFGGGKDTVDFDAAFDNSEVKLGAGNDSLIVGTTSGQATIYGGAGNDSFTLTGLATKVVLTDSDGVTRLVSDGGITDGTITLGSAADTVVDVGGDEVLTTTSLDMAAGNDTLNFHDTIGSTIKAGAGDDSLTLDGEIDNSGTDNSYIYLGAGNDTLALTETADDFILESSSGNNRVTLTGNVGASTAAGFTNTITFGTGADTLDIQGVVTNTVTKMGAGNDSIILGEDFENATGTNTLYGGDGTDTVLFNEAGKGVADLAFTYWKGIEVASFNPGNNDDTMNLGIKAQAAGVVKATVAGTGSNISASAYTSAIHLIAEGSGNDLTGGAGADTLVGGTGVNVITTNGGNDTISGGVGDDDFIVNGTSAQTVVITDLDEGDSIVTTGTATVNATVKAAAGVTANDGNNFGAVNVTVTDALNAGATVSFAAVAAGVDEKGYTIVATANNNTLAITGTQSADTITSGSGNDTITGADGADSIALGTGTNVLVVTNGLTVDNVTGFGTEEVFAIDISEVETANKVVSGETMDLVDGDGTAVAANTVAVVQDIGAAANNAQVAMGATTTVLKYTAAKLANAAALETALELGGGILKTGLVGLEENDAFFFTYQSSSSDDWNLAIGYVETADVAATTVLDKWKVLDVATTDAGSVFTAANFDYI